MKNDGILLIVMLLACMTGWAQSGAQRTMHDRQAERMKRELSLSDAQVKEVIEANHNFRKAHMQVTSDTSLTRREIMERRKALVASQEEQIKRILTPQQYEKWMSAKPASGRRDSSARRANGRDHMKTKLGLNDEQARNVSEIQVEMMRKFRQLHKDSTVSAESRKADQKRIVEERNAKLKKVLTEEQYASFQELQKEQMRRRRPSRH